MIKNDSFKLGLTNVLIRIVGMFILIPIYRLLEERGVLLIAISFIPFIFFTDFCSIGIIPGFSYLTSKYSKQNEEAKLNYMFKRCKKIMLLVGLIFGLLLIIITPLLVDVYDHDISIKIIKLSFLAIIPTLFLFPLVSLHRGYLLGKQLVNKVSISIIIEHLSRYIFIFISAFLIIRVFNKEHHIAVIFFILASFIGLIASLLYLKCKVGTSKEVEKTKYLKEIITTFIPIGLTTIFITIYLMIDLITVSAIKDENMAMYLFKIPRLLIIPILLSQAVAATTMPLITKTKDVDKKAIEINKALDLVVSVSVVSIVLYIRFSDNIYNLFYNKSDMAVIALKYFSILVMLYSLNKVLIGIIQGIKKLKYILMATISSYVVKLILNIMLVQRVSYYAFLISSIVSVSIVIITSLVILKKEKYFCFKEIFKDLGVNTSVSSISLLPLVIFSNFLDVGDNKIIIGIYLLINFSFFIITFVKLKTFLSKKIML